MSTRLSTVPLLLTLLLLLCVYPKVAQAGAILSGPLVQVTDTGLGEFGNGERPAIAAFGSTLYAVWGDTRTFAPTAFANYEALFAKSTDGGLTWSSNQIISDPDWDGGATEYHTIAVAPDGTIYVAWYLERCSSFGDPAKCGGEDRENDIRLAISQDGGKNFTLVTFWDGDDDQSAILAPQIAVDPNISIFYGLVDDYLSDEQHDIYLRGIDPASGDKWLLQLNSQNGSGRVAELLAPQGLALAARNGVVCAAWEDSRSDGAIYGTCSTDKGKSFANDAPFSAANGSHPRLAIAPDGKLQLLYQIDDNLFVRTSSNQGKNWTIPLKLNTDSDRTFNQTLTVDANGTLAVLRQTVDKSLLYTSIDGGQRFTSRATGDGDAAKLTTIGAGDQAQAVWIEKRRNNSQEQIWSNRAILDATLPTTPGNVQAQGKDRAISLNWTPSSDHNGIAFYDVLRSANAAGPFAPINALGVQQTTFTDVELDGKLYFYQIVAVDGSGNRSLASTPVSAQATVGTDLSAYQGTIAYQSSNAIHLRSFANLAQDQTLAPGLRPYFAADGKRLFYYQGSSKSILSNAIGGDDERTLFSENKLTELYDLTPDGATIGRVAIQEYQQFGNPVPCQAFEPRVGGTNGTTNFSQASAIVTDLALSPDGKWLLYRNTGVCNTVAIGYFTAKLCIANLVTNQTSCDDSLDYRSPNYSPDSRSLVFAASFSGQMEIWKAAVRVDGSLANFAQLTHGDSGIVSDHPHWSSNGKSIIFQRDIDPGSGVNLQLFILQQDGSSLRSLGIAGEQPTWYNGSTQPSNTNSDSIFLPLIVR
ncbi:MAG: hypothetical protein U0175_38135 [Caldilineaceae bacterium]